MALMQEARTDVQWTPEPGPALKRRMAQASGAVERTRGSFMPIVWMAQAVPTGSATVKLIFPSTFYKAKEGWIGTVLALPGCVSQADTFDDAKASLESAVRDVLRVHKKRGTATVFCEPAEDVDPSSIVNIHVDVEGT